MFETIMITLTINEAVERRARRRHEFSSHNILTQFNLAIQSVTFNNKKCELLFECVYCEHMHMTTTSHHKLCSFSEKALLQHIKWPTKGEDKNTPNKFKWNNQKPKKTTNIGYAHTLEIFACNWSIHGSLTHHLNAALICATTNCQ